MRSTAALSLGRMRSRKAVTPLLDLLGDEYESVQEAAIHALAAIGDESALDGLTKDFSSHEAYMRRNIVLLLGRFSTEKAVDALAFALKDEEPDVRKAVVNALANAPGAKALRPLLLAATDDDPEVRMPAAEALGAMDASEAREALIALLADTDLWVRAAAARGLGRIGGAKAGEVLTGYLGTASDIFLLALVEVLGRLRYGPARDPLLKLADHKDPEVRKTVLAALDGFEGNEVLLGRACTTVGPALERAEGRGRGAQAQARSGGRSASREDCRRRSGYGGTAGGERGIGEINV